MLIEAIKYIKLNSTLPPSTPAVSLSTAGKTGLSESSLGTQTKLSSDSAGSMAQFESDDNILNF